MNGQTATTQDLLTEINAIEKALSDLKRKVLSFVPPQYGSDAWWEESDEKAREDIKNGNFTTLKNEKELKKYLGL